MTRKPPPRRRLRVACVLALACGGAVLATPGVATAGAAPSTRGALVSSTRVAQLGPAGVKRTIGQMGLDPAQVRAGVDAYRLVYRTIGTAGRPATASGLVVLPRDGARELRTIAYEHGTNVPRALAPSTGADSDARLTALLFGSAGYAAVAPDYLGLGTGPGPQAYLDVASEVSASVDMLEAARAFAASRGRRLDTRILVSGFSQGGQAAMGLAKALQSGVDPQLSLRAVAPIAGVYDIEHAELPAILSGRMEPTISNYNLTAFALSWQRLDHLSSRAGDVFQPRTARIRRLFDGRHDDPAIFAALPHRLGALFTPAFLRRLAHPRGRLLRALRVNDATCDWAPKVPVRLYAAHGDRAVTIANSRSCRRMLSAHGVNVPLVDLGDYDHLPSAAVAIPRVLSWLEQQ